MTATLMGQTLDGRYRLDAPLGAGSMGEVYRGMQVSLMRPVAVKVLPTRMVGQPDLVQRFEREAQLLSRLKHPGIVSVIDFGWSQGRPYLVMELVVGQSIEQLLVNDGKLPPEKVARYLVELCEALDHAHSMGVLHRDLKPSNILVEDDHMRVVDFGVARALEHGNANITGEGMVLGTPKYCSPEQAMGLALDGRSDLYALGVVCWRMLVGKVPFDGEGPAAIFSKHVLEVPPPLAQVAGLTGEWKGLGAVIDRMLAKTPGDRFATPLEAARIVQAILGVSIEVPRATVPAIIPRSPGEALPRVPSAARGASLPGGVVVPAPPSELGVAPVPGGPRDFVGALAETHMPDARTRLPTPPPLLSRDTAPIRPPRRTSSDASPREARDEAARAPDDDAHDTLLDDIARTRHESSPPLPLLRDGLDDSGFAPTKVSGPPRRGAPPASRSWIDRHPGLATAAVVGVIAAAAWFAASQSSTTTSTRPAVALPPIAVEARARIEKGEARAAAQSLESAVERSPNDPALRVALGHAYVRSDRAEDAIPHYVWAAKKAPAVFDDAHAADLVTLGDVSKAPLQRLELARARERIGETAPVLELARAALDTTACEDKRAAIKLLRERDGADAIPLLEPLAKGKSCGASEAKKAVEALAAE